METSRRPRRALFWSYDRRLPSFRHRMAILVPELERRGWRCDVDELPNRRNYLRRVLARRQALRAADVLIMHRTQLSPVELWPLRASSRRIVFDVDDAIYFRRPRKPGDPPGRLWFRQFKFARTAATVDLVIAGNRTLADVAARTARRVEIVPTSVDLESYETGVRVNRDPRTLVWIGLPENLAYLELIRPVLARLAPRYPDLRLRVVSSAFPDWSDVPLERVPWSPKTEADSLRTAGIGVMPLTDDDWTRGKCAFKLLQYMAAELPTVGSAVGANIDTVVDGTSGFLVTDEDDWDRALRALLDDPQRAARMGREGRERVRNHYDRRILAPRVADLVERLEG